MIRAIAFDWGGVFTRGTFDSSAVVALASAYGEDTETIAARYFPLMEAFEVGAIDLPTFHQRFEAAAEPVDARSTDAGPSLRAAAVARAHHPQQLGEVDFRSTFLGAVRWREAMFPLLASIPTHYTVGMMSNNVPVLCHLVREDPRMARIEHFVFSNEVAVRKPDAAAFAALSEALGVPPQETVFVDDNQDNIRACRELGFTGLLIDEREAFIRRWEAALPDLPVPPELRASGGIW